MAEDSIFVMHRFVLDGLSDALVMPEAEYRALSPADIEKMKRDRVKAWKQNVKDASSRPTPKPTKKELQERLADLDRERVQVEAQMEG